MSTEPAARKRTRLSPEERKQQLILIGARLFAERPFSDVWIEEVAKEAGVSRGLVYHYFPNKRDFFAEVVRMGAEVSLRLTAPDPSLPPAEQLRTGLNHFLQYVESNEDAFRAIHLGGFSADDEVRGIVRQARDIQLRRLLTYVAPDGEPTPLLELAVSAWMQFNNSVIFDWLDNKQAPREEVIDLMAGALVGVVAAAQRAQGDPSATPLSAVIDAVENS